MYTAPIHELKARAGAALLCLAWLLPTLIGHDPWKPDEAYSFGLVWHILDTGDWVVPALAGEPFMEKPPLFYLSAAAFAKLFSPLLPYHDGARLAAGFYMALALLFTALAAREICGRALAAVVALLASSGLLVWSHLLITDTALLAGIAIALSGFALGARRPVMGAISLGTGAGVAFLSKGLLGPGMLGLTAVALLLLFPAWRTRGYARFLLMAAIAALPWFAIWPVALYLRSPELFGQWFWVNNVGRFVGFSTLSSPNQPFFYFLLLPLYALPAVALALYALVRTLYERSVHPALQIPIAATIAMLLVLSVAHDARDVYALPLLLPLSILAASVLTLTPRWLGTTLTSLGTLATLTAALVLWLAWFAIDFGVPRLAADYLRAALPHYILNRSPGAIVLAVLYTSACVVALMVWRRHLLRPLLPWAIAHTLLLGLIAALFLPTLDYTKSYRLPVFRLAQNLPPTYACIGSVGLGEPQRAMLHYFAGITTTRVDAPEDTPCELLLIQNDTGHGHRPDAEIWELIWQGARPGDRKEQLQLLTRRASVHQAAGDY